MTYKDAHRDARRHYQAGQSTREAKRLGLSESIADAAMMVGDGFEAALSAGTLYLRIEGKQPKSVQLSRRQFRQLAIWFIGDHKARRQVFALLPAHPQ